MRVFLDSNVLLDLFAEQGTWRPWAEQQIEPYAGRSGALLINAIVYAEISSRLSSRPVLDTILADLGVRMVEASREALFVAGKAFAAYRDKGGSRETILPDFLIGAHARDLGVQLVTRDVRRYRTYFPDLELITP